ncbi:hypothetical protein AB0H42_20530 [Nocardia sp. NPDC050799]
MCATTLPTRVRGETDIPDGTVWAVPTLVHLEHLLKVMRRWAEVAEERGV